MCCFVLYYIEYVALRCVIVLLHCICVVFYCFVISFTMASTLLVLHIVHLGIPCRIQNKMDCI